MLEYQIDGKIVDTNAHMNYRQLDSNEEHRLYLISLGHTTNHSAYRQKNG